MNQVTHYLARIASMKRRLELTILEYPHDKRLISDASLRVRETMAKAKVLGLEHKIIRIRGRSDTDGEFIQYYTGLDTNEATDKFNLDWPDCNIITLNEIPFYHIV